jgi:hypothetical protein
MAGEREAVGDRAPRDGEVRIGVRKHVERRSAPALDGARHAFGDPARAEDPAVQEQR